MKVMITGAQGQVGQALRATAPGDLEVLPRTRVELDIADASSVTNAVLSARPQLIVNSAAYTAVDRAESEQDMARRVNEQGAHNIAAAAARVGARVIHLSTDFVFDGAKSTPYQPDDAPHPLSVYGATKLAGERAVREQLGERALIVRTSWVYAAAGNNFVRTMLRLMRERGTVRVVADQVGSPTAAASVAEIVWKCAALPDLHGIYHWTDSGVASWYDFAVAIAEEASAGGLLTTPVTVVPIATADYPTAARRPSYSVLDKSRTTSAASLVPPHWRQNLRRVLGEMPRA